MEDEFILHPQLEKDTFPVGSLELTEVLLMNDRRYPWLILVPRRNGVSDIVGLNDSERKMLFDEITFVSEKLKNHFQSERLNIAMLGNMVPQLHCHIIARFKEDFAWPKPVWGIGDAVPYSDEERDAVILQFRDQLLFK